LGSTVSPQDILPGEEDGKIPNYIHLENLEGIAPNGEIKSYTLTRQGSL